MAKKWMKFPNGKVWLVDDENGYVEGTVRVENRGEDGFMDDLSEAVTGHPSGLTGFSYGCVGGNVFEFGGMVDTMLEEEPDAVTLVPDKSGELVDCLARQYGLSKVEAAHAVGGLNLRYEGEQAYRIVGSMREIRIPKDGGLDYIRIVVDGIEIAYWNSDELAEDPQDVVLAMLGAAGKGETLQAKVDGDSTSFKSWMDAMEDACRASGMSDEQPGLFVQGFVEWNMSRIGEPGLVDDLLATFAQSYDIVVQKLPDGSWRWLRDNQGA